MTATTQRTGRAEWKSYRCLACGHVQSISTNHYGECFDYCGGCSWKSQGYRPDVSAQMFGRSYRRFEITEALQ
jgi:DNA-directed RNA polymerase subunit RPC12/RpoP